MFCAMILFALATAIALPLTPEEQADIRCVAVIAAAAAPGATATANGREYTVMVGADIMDRTGRTREDIGQLMLAQARDAVARRSITLELDACTARANARLAADTAAPLPLPVPQR